MRDYGQVQTSFWNHPDVTGLSDAAKLLAVYLLTSPHSNALGCYRLPRGYVSADLGWNAEAVERAADELVAAGLIRRDALSGWTLFPNYLKWNPAQNPNVGKAVLRQARAVPRDFPYREDLVLALRRYGVHLPPGWERALHAPEREADVDDPSQRERNRAQVRQLVAQVLERKAAPGEARP